MSDGGEDEPKDEPTEGSEQQSEQQPVEGDQPSTQANDSSADGDQSAESQQEPAESDQSTDQPEEQPAESDQPADDSSEPEGDSDEATAQSEDKTVDEGDQKADNTGAESEDSSDKLEQPVDESRSTQVAMADTEGGGGTGGGGDSQKSAGPKMSPFPQKLPDPLNVGSGFSNAIQIALNHSIVGDGAANKGVIDDSRFSGLPDPRRIPITIVALDGSGQAAGQNELDMYYSGSLLKVAAMYAAYQLRIAVNDLAATLPIDPANDAVATTNLFNTIRASFDDEIANKVALLPASIDRGLRVPKYETIFTATRPPGGRFTLEFTTGDHSADPEHVPSATFEPNLFDMIVGSHNAAAGFCIRNLGYGWINGLLESAGLFFPINVPPAGRSGLGIWLAGDYGSAKVATIESVNDGDVKQVTDTRHMAQLFTLLFNKTLVRNVANPPFMTGNVAMLDLLSQAVDHPHARSLLKRSSPAPSFTVLNSKIGVGELKGGACIDIPARGVVTDRCTYSEAAILESGGRKFVVVWQAIVYRKENPAAWGAEILRMVTIIQKTIDNFHS
jgi:hypothetical protein